MAIRDRITQFVTYLVKQIKCSQGGILIGRVTGEGKAQEITVGSGLSFSGTTLTATGSQPGHTHDDRYYTEGEVDGLLGGKADAETTLGGYGITDAAPVLIRSAAQGRPTGTVYQVDRIQMAGFGTLSIPPFNQFSVSWNGQAAIEFSMASLAQAGGNTLTLSLAHQMDAIPEISAVWTVEADGTEIVMTRNAQGHLSGFTFYSDPGNAMYHSGVTETQGVVGTAAVCVGQLSRTGDAAPYLWDIWNGTAWEPIHLPNTTLTASKSVANAAARLALSLENAQGFAVVDADTGKTWMLVEGGTPSVSSDWLQLGDRDITAADITDPENVVLAGIADDPAAVKTALVLSDAASASTTHPNASAALRPLAEHLRAGISCSAVVVGDSTGNGLYSAETESSWRWPRFLAQKIADEHPEFGVEFAQISNTSTKAWDAVTVQAAPNGELREYFKPRSTDIAAWDSGTAYTAGQFVTYGGSTWFCQTSHAASATPPRVQSYPTLGNDNWRIISATTYLAAPGEESPLIHDEGVTTAKVPQTSSLEFLVDFVMPAGGLVVGDATRPLWGKQGVANPSGAANTDGRFNIDMTYEKKAILTWRPTHDFGSQLTATCTTALPVDDGTRCRLRVRFNPNNGSNRVTEFAYATHNGSVWSSYTVHETITSTTTTWIKPSGDHNLGGWAGFGTGLPGIVIYGFSIRNGIADTSPFDFNLPIDCWHGRGVKDRCMLGSPVCKIWSASWNGTELNHFLGELTVVTSPATYFSIATDIPSPENVVAAFVNVGHNGEGSYLQGGRNAASYYERVSDALIDRLPNASVIGMSQNPGTLGTIPASGDYTLHEWYKNSKQAARMQAAARRGDGWIDIHRVFRNHGDQAALSAAQDGLHPNAAGSELWSDTIFDLIEK